MAEFLADTTALITAIGALAGVIGTLVVAVSGFFKASRAKEVAVRIGEGLKETDKWVLENEQKLVTVLTVAYNLTPQEQKDAAQKYSELIAKYNGDIRAVTEELKKLYGPAGVPDSS
jgi:hypothetical protein